MPSVDYQTGAKLIQTMMAVDLVTGFKSAEETDAAAASFLGPLGEALAADQTCATNVLRRFLVCLEIGVSATFPRTAPNFDRTRARRIHNASSISRELPTAAHADGTLQPSDSIAVNDALAMLPSPAIERRSTHQLQTRIRGRTSTVVGSHTIRQEKEGLSVEAGGAYAREKSAPFAVSGKLQVTKPGSNALDKDWLEIVTQDSRAKDDGHPSIFKAAERAESAQQGDEHRDDRPNSMNTATKSFPGLPPLPKINPLGWQVQKYALTKKFPPGWVPRKRLSPDTIEGIRSLHAHHPTKYTTPVLADQFKVSPEAIRRILKSKWRPTDEQEQERRDRWEKRGRKIWEDLSEKGVKPPRKWRTLGIGKRKPEGGWEKGPTRRERRMVEHVERERVRESLRQGPSAVVAERADVGYQVPLAERIL